MYLNLIMKGIGFYHPKQAFNNDYFIEHFKKLGIEVQGLMKHMGRNTRYKAVGTGENSLSMALAAAKQALEQSQLDAEDLDMIVFASDSPEFLTPINALILNHELHAKNAHLVFDISANCISMITACDLIRSYVQGGKVKNILLASGSLITPFAKENDPIVYPTTADAGAAVILQAREEPIQRGFIDSNYFTDSSYQWTIRMPNCGLSHMYDEDISIEDKKMAWNPFSFDFLSINWSILITTMLANHNLTPQDIDLYMFSQLSKADIQKTADKLNIDFNRCIFVGDQYGYTGPTSPFVALYDAILHNRVPDNAHIVFCSIGAGYTLGTSLYKY